MRLDAYLTSEKIISGREHAKELIRSGGISVNGKIVTKPAAEVGEGDRVEVIGEKLRYVGRGGLKLEKAVNAFGIDLDGRVCADFGASTGGFTDCMLMNGAGKVFAIDVGHGQLAEKLLSDERVINMEGVNLRSLKADALGGGVDFIGCDVSFISLKLIIPVIAEVLSEEGEAVVLVKPQFECGRSDIGKNGIVKSEKVHIRVLNEISAAFQASGMAADRLAHSPICGGDGNIEYIVHALFQSRCRCVDFDPISAVRTAFDELSR